MLGEFDLIGLLRERIAAAGAVVGDNVLVGSGDDAAVVVPRGTTVTSVDALVEGVHFKRSTFPPDAIGHKALAVALSDLAAMGAQPGEAYIQLGVPEDSTEEELAGIADGMGAVAYQYSVSVAGGDVVASPVLFLAVTVVGYLRDDDGPHITRAGAQEGDVLILTGPVGGASAGLRLLEDENLASGLDPSLAEKLRQRQLRPQALTGAGLALARCGAHAMIDVSDGIGADAGHLAAASGVRCVVELGSGAIAPGVEEVAEASGEDPLELASGGEDYELLAAVPPELADEALEAVRRTASDPAVGGRVEAGEGVVLRGPTGREVSGRGFDQVRSRVRGEPT